MYVNLCIFIGRLILTNNSERYFCRKIIFETFLYMQRIIYSICIYYNQTLIIIMNLIK